MAGVTSLAEQLAPHWPAGLPLMSCSKGLDLQLLATASQLWSNQLADAPLLVLSGPNLATEVRQGLPAASVIAAADQDLARRFQQQLSDNSLRLYTNNDPIGTEAAAALKNVMAVAAGISDGLGLGANAKASLLCRGLAEIGVVLEGFGGATSTLYGLAGLGDLLQLPIAASAATIDAACCWPRAAANSRPTSASLPPLRGRVRPGQLSSWQAVRVGICLSVSRLCWCSKAAPLLAPRSRL